MQHKGLSDNEIIESRSKHGQNIISPPPKESLLKLFFEKFNDPIIKILLVAAFLSLLIGFINNHYIETVGIFLAIFLATGVSFWFEYDANKKFDILNLVNDDSSVKVIRNGIVTEISKKDIVVGDIIVLAIGDEVPADGLILESVSLQVDESSLTGEVLVEKSHEPRVETEKLAYPCNYLLRGSKVLDGNCIFRVELVGDKTEYGKLAKSSVENSEVKTPLNLQLDKLARVIGIIGTSVAVLTFFSLLIKDLVLGEITFTAIQVYYLLNIALFFALVSIKFWFPLLTLLFAAVLKLKFSWQTRITTYSNYKIFLLSILIFIVLSFIPYFFGLSPFQSNVWIDIKTASTILQYFMVAVTLIVVTVPEGLPMSVNLSLALSMRNMLKANNLVRKMHATETLGACTVICTDKTGTLTQNQMQVADAMFFGRTFAKFSDNYENEFLIKENISANSTSNLDYSDKNKVKGVGNPTETALLLWLDKLNCSYQDIRNSSDLLGQLSFSTERKYMASIIFSPILKKKILYVKGASEIVFNLSSKVYCENGIKELADCSDIIQEILEKNHAQALRTLGFAYEIIEDDKNRIQDGFLVNHNLTFYGLIGIADPLREDVPMAVQTCMKAGIDVKIVTGDTYGIAVEIAKNIGIISKTDANNLVLTGDEFAKLTDDELLPIIKELKILCRARPSDKQRLVQLLQNLGEIVAVTGDGSNDAPALNFAHVGLSMGSGTAVAKEASDITIIDDSFNSISSAVLWGRTLYQNIQKFVVFQLSINLVAMIIVLVGSILGHELPLTITQMLWINLIMDTFAAAAFASLPPNKIVMNHKPRKNNSFIINSKMSNSIFFSGISFSVLLIGLLIYFSDEYQNISIYNLSLFFTAFVFLQFWNMFNVKALFTGKSVFIGLFKSKTFLIVALAILSGQIIIVQFGGEMFRTVPLDLKDWFLLFGLSSIVLWVGEIKRILF